MSTPTQGAPEPDLDTVRRRPEQLLLAFTGELMLAGGAGPLPASVLIAVLGELGVNEAATRAGPIMWLIPPERPRRRHA